MTQSRNKKRNEDVNCSISRLLNNKKKFKRRKKENGGKKTQQKGCGIWSADADANINNSTAQTTTTKLKRKMVQASLESGRFKSQRYIERTPNILNPYVRADVLIKKMETSLENGSRNLYRLLFHFKNKRETKKKQQNERRNQKKRKF